MASDHDRNRISAIRTLEPGAVVAGRFVVEGLLGEGGMGRVYLAVQKPMGRKVALKVIRTDLEQSENTLKRFFREALVISKLRHPNTITLFDYGDSEDGSLFIAMEYLEGMSLTDLMAVHGQLSLQRAVRIVAQIGLSLAEAHRKGIFHRDLKPDNVFLLEVEGQPDFVKVIDFGIAHLRQGDLSTRITRTGFVCGTPEYMSPEQARGDAVDHRTDFYSLGIMIYEMLEGRLPYAGDTPFAIAVKHQTEPVPPLSKSFPRPVRQFVARLMAKKPEERPDTAEQMLHELKAALPNDISLGPVVLTSLPSGKQAATRTKTPPGPRDTDEMAQSLAATRSGEPMRSGRRSRRLLVGVGVSSLAVVLLLGFYLTTLRDRGAQAPEPEGSPVPERASRDEPMTAMATVVGAQQPGDTGGTGDDVPKPAVAAGAQSQGPSGQGQATEVKPVPEMVAAVEPPQSSLEPLPEVAPPSRQPAVVPVEVDIRIESEPSGADLFIDNRLVGLTPLVLEFEPGRTIELRLRKEGYEDDVTTVEVRSDVDNSGLGPIVLRRICVLSIQSVPTGAQLTDLDSQISYGVTPATFRVACSGEEIAIQVSRSGYREQTLRVRPDQSTEPIRVELERIRRGRRDRNEEPAGRDDGERQSDGDERPQDDRPRGQDRQDRRSSPFGGTVD